MPLSQELTGAGIKQNDNTPDKIIQRTIYGEQGNPYTGVGGINKGDPVLAGSNVELSAKPVTTATSSGIKVGGYDSSVNSGDYINPVVTGNKVANAPNIDPVLSSNSKESGASYGTTAMKTGVVKPYDNIDPILGVPGKSSTGETADGSKPEMTDAEKAYWEWKYSQQGNNGNNGNGGNGGASSPANTAYNPYAANANHGTANAIQLQSYTADPDRINELYGQRQDAQLLALQNAYNASRASAEQSMQDIPQSYIEASNAAEARAMQNQRAFNEAAAANGLNVGTGAQAQLAQTNALQNELSSIRAQQANAQAQAQFNLQQLEQNYQNSVAEAIANNEFQKASALMDAYEKERQSAIDTANKQAQLDQAAMETRAANLAQYGDFSAYAELGYSADEIKAMFNAWKAANPDLYKKIYGGGSSGGSGWSIYNSAQGAFTRDLLANSGGYTQNQINTAIDNYVKENNLTSGTADAMRNYYTQLIN